MPRSELNSSGRDEFRQYDQLFSYWRRKITGSTASLRSSLAPNQDKGSGVRVGNLPCKVVFPTCRGPIIPQRLSLRASSIGMAADRIIILVYYIISVRFAMIDRERQQQGQLERGRGVAGGVSRTNPKGLRNSILPKRRESRVRMPVGASSRCVPWVVSLFLPLRSNARPGKGSSPTLKGGEDRRKAEASPRSDSLTQ